MSSLVPGDLVNGGDRASNDSVVLNTLIRKYSCIHKPNHPLPSPGDGRYLTSLWIFGNQEVDEPESSPPTGCSKLMVDQNTIDTQMIKAKIIAALKILSFREPRVFIQFWSPVAVHKRCLLTTLDQPFGLGMVDEGLLLYRSESEQQVLVVNGDYNEKELGPPARVYQTKLPEWSFDVHGLSTRQYVRDWAARYKIHGYIDLPVFEPTSGCCVGVLELITSSNYVDYAYEVREISKALKEENLKSPNVFELCTQVGDERRQHEQYEIFRALKSICDIQNLPLAQTWALSGHSSSVANSGDLEKSCSSFNKSCIGKACMSTAALPFHVQDLSMWGFYEASRDRHLEKSLGVVGRSLSSRGSCFCEDVTELSQDEYPLVHIASMNGITSCLAIYLNSVETDNEYVMELFLPPHDANKTDVKSLVKTVKQQFKNATMVRLGTTSSTQVMGGGVPFNYNLKSPPLSKMLLTGVSLRPAAENEQNDVGVDPSCTKKRTQVAYVEQTEDYNVENEPSNSAAVGTSQSVVPCSEKRETINRGRMRIKHSEISNDPNAKRKKTDWSISLEEIKKHYGKTVDEAAVSLHVSRSTLKRICRSLDIPRWPYRKGPNETDSLLKPDQMDTVALVFQPSDEPSGTANRTRDHAPLIEHGKHTSAHGSMRGKHIDNINVTIKASYGDDIVKFPFILSDGLVKLKKLVATRFRLGVGSFNLKYLDEDGDKILITCDSDLTGSLGGSRRLNVKNVIQLFVQPVPVN